jgi:hypothetical protein
MLAHVLPNGRQPMVKERGQFAAAVLYCVAQLLDVVCVTAFVHYQ